MDRNNRRKRKQKEQVRELLASLLLTALILMLLVATLELSQGVALGLWLSLGLSLAMLLTLLAAFLAAWLPPVPELLRAIVALLPRHSYTQGSLLKIFPEEAVAVLAALRQRLKRSKKHSTYIQLRMIWEFLHLLWAVHIQIKIGNLWLPKRSSTKQGVDSVVEMVMEELEAIDISFMWNRLQEQAQSIERSRRNLREQYQTLEQLLLETEIRNPLQEQMPLFDHLCMELQEQFQVIEQLRLKIEVLSPTQLKEPATRLQLLLELKFKLEQLQKRVLHLQLMASRVSMRLIAFMLVQLPIHMLLSLLSLILLPLIVRASKFLPEEAVAELAAFHQRLKRSRKNAIYIQFRMTWHFLETLWAFYIKIKIDNLWLANKSSTK